MPQSFKDYMAMGSHGRDTGDPRLKRRVGSRVLMNPEYDQETMMPMTQPTMADTPMLEPDQQLAMNLDKLETYLGDTKYGHPIIERRR